MLYYEFIPIQAIIKFDHKCVTNKGVFKTMSGNSKRVYAYRIFLGFAFQAVVSVFSPNTGNSEQKKNTYSDTFEGMSGEEKLKNLKCKHKQIQMNFCAC